MNYGNNDEISVLFLAYFKFKLLHQKGLEEMHLQEISIFDLVLGGSRSRKMRRFTFARIDISYARCFFLPKRGKCTIICAFKLHGF